MLLTFFAYVFQLMYLMLLMLFSFFTDVVYSIIRILILILYLDLDFSLCFLFLFRCCFYILQMFLVDICNFFMYLMFLILLTYRSRPCVELTYYSFPSPPPLPKKRKKSSSMWKAYDMVFIPLHLVENICIIKWFNIMKNVLIDLLSCN